MAHSETELDDLEKEIPRLASAALSGAYRQALAAGQVVLVSGEDGIYQASPDGHRTLVKAVPPALHLPVGTRIRIS